MPVPVEISGLIVPLKPPRAGKSRLRGAVDEHDHAALVLALAWDTLAAATDAGVRRVLVVAADPAAVSGLRRPGVEVVGERGDGDLNSALRQGEALLRQREPDAVVGAIQADLPALRPAELAAALAAAEGRRVFVADADGTGTTLLLSEPGGPLDPRFGAGSAAAHAGSGAVPLELDLPTLRRDVDTPADLAEACRLGVGDRTRAVLCSREVA
ncbi:2-phospho-L-lactate guanylyltransferase [Amycolatopsis methanolica]|uniref:Phosphoenolpyruvate guanylyltransferase n=1 Tax=Amycolatopsis methanolica 239 TaxID=1068978 RepID=A0A076MLG9_AMYME|nr:2-phospho-L-lactate guanylyltransferase [Amycolatopsis methanolica]AIJ21623.1 2-phospho-L-lactate guanylyltransferase CofC [Amycolatopsis methanolica 239]